MAIVINNTETLLHTPSAPECGMPAQCWIPGKNPLDPKYWGEAKNNWTIKRWLKVKVKGKGKPMIEVDLKGSMPDPLKPPKLEELTDHAEDYEIQEMLDDRSTPESWKPILKQALGTLGNRKVQDKANRDADRLEARMGAGAGTKGLTGMPVRLAVPKVEAETDVDTLVGWYDADDRTTVRKAIDKRMGELEEPEPTSEPETAAEEPSEQGED